MAPVPRFLDYHNSDGIITDMGKYSFKVFLLISIAIHLSMISIVGNLYHKPARDKDNTLSVEIMPLPPQEKKLKKEKLARKRIREPLRPGKRTKKLQSRKPKKTDRPSVRPIGLTKSYKQRKSTPPKREDTILLDTKNPKYTSYSSRIKRKIELAWEYPSEARTEEIQGRLTLMFSILRSGRLGGLELLRSSGFRVLDSGALNAVKCAAPYYPIPQKMGIDRLNIIATFEYQVDYSQ